MRNSEPENREYIVKQIGNAQAVITGSDVIDKYVMDKCPNLKIISKHGVGLDSIDLKEAERRGIKVTKTPDANNESVADLTLMFMLYLLREINNNRITSASPDWSTKKLSHDLYQNTIGLIGFGKIGRAVAKRLEAFQCNVLVYDPYIKEDQISGEYISLCPFEEVLSRSNVISLHLPLTEQTRGMIKRETIEKMKDGVILINTSRGALVDEKALYEALQSGKVGGAGLDVYSVEPPVNEPMLIHEHVLCTPHIAPHTEEANYRMGMAAAANVVHYFEENEERNTSGG